MKAILFKNENNITQVTQGQYDTPSHYSLFAMDLIGVYLKAPFDLKYVAKSNFGGVSTQLYYQSTVKVELANGTTNYVWFYVDHSYDNPAIGTIYKQGQKFINIGDKGLGSGKHAHIIGGIGTVNTSNLTFTSLGVGTNSGYTSYKPNCGTNSNFRDIYFLDGKIEYLYDAKKENFKTMPTEQYKYYGKVVTDLSKTRYYPKSAQCLIECTNETSFYQEPELKNRASSTNFLVGQRVVSSPYKTVALNGKNHLVHEIKNNQNGVTCYFAYRRDL